MPRSPDAVLTARLELIKGLADDLARANGGEASITDALADRIKQEIESVGRALKRPKRRQSMGQLHKPRRLGEILKKAPKNKDTKGSKVTGSRRVPVKDPTPTLKEIGLTKKESSVASVRWRADVTH